MTKQISLATYIVRVKKADKDIDLDKIDEDNDLFDALRAYLIYRSCHHRVDPFDETVLYTWEFGEANRMFSGVIKRGQFGYQNDIVGIEDLELNYQKQINEAFVTPFYFLFLIPNGLPAGIITLQMFGSSGIKTDFHDDFRRFFKAYFPKYRIEIDSIFPTKELKNYFKQGEIRRMRFLKRTPPRDITDKIGRGFDQDDFEVSIEIKAKRHHSLPRLFNKGIESYLFSDDVKQFAELIPFEDKTTDEAIIDVKHKGKIKRFNLFHEEEFRPIFDVTDKVELQNGYPTYQSIDPVAKELALDIARNHIDRDHLPDPQEVKLKKYTEKDLDTVEGFDFSNLDEVYA